MNGRDGLVIRDLSHLLEYHRFVLREIPSLEGKSVLDCGCGRGIWAYLMRSEKGGVNSAIIGLDVHGPYLRYCKRFRIYDNLIRADVASLPFVESSFNVVLAIEIIEHLPKDKGLDMLHELERVCTEKVVLTTPNGFWRQKEIPNGVKSEAHCCGWTVGDLGSVGYTVRAIGLKLGRHVIDKPELWGLLHYVFTPAAQMLPWMGELLIATKKVKVTKYDQATPNKRLKTKDSSTS